MVPYKQLSLADIFSDCHENFDNLVDVTEPICQAIDSAKADITIFDSSGIFLFITETSSSPIPISLSKRNPIPLMKINVFMIQNF